MAGFLTELHVEGYRCLKDVTCKLTPLHAFIGPNDSGKSTVLNAIAGVINAPASLNARVEATFFDGSIVMSRVSNVPIVTTAAGGPWEVIGAALQRGPSVLGVQVLSRQKVAQFVRLDADELRRAGSLIAHASPLSLAGRGANIASLYDAVRDRSVERFIAISSQVTNFFPSVKTLGLRATGPGEKVLAATLVDGNEVLSKDMSEGLLYYLAYAILGELSRPAVYLVEEPENGLHPSRIADIVKMLRAIAEDPENPVQVIMATHSPLVVNELRPEEVTVVTRDPVTGTKLRSILETPHFEKRSQVYALGELWLSYADGKTEAALFDEKER
jgi:predicted ATPase